VKTETLFHSDVIFFCGLVSNVPASFSGDLFFEFWPQTGLCILFSFSSFP
jgi:hypothetical protein